MTIPNDTSRPPWGFSAQSALRWAFALCLPPSSPNAIGQARTKEKAKIDLTPLELRGQAALIRQKVDTLGHPPSKALIVSYYLPKPDIENGPGIAKDGSRSGGRVVVDRFGDIRQPAVHALAWWLLTQQGTGSHNIRGYQEAVLQYCLDYRNHDRLAELLRCRRERVPGKRENLAKTLDDLHGRAIVLIRGKLESAGLL